MSECLTDAFSLLVLLLIVTLSLVHQNATNLPLSIHDRHDVPELGIVPWEWLLTILWFAVVAMGRLNDPRHRHGEGEDAPQKIEDLSVYFWKIHKSRRGINLPWRSSLVSYHFQFVPALALHQVKLSREINAILFCSFQLLVQIPLEVGHVIGLEEAPLQILVDQVWILKIVIEDRVQVQAAVLTRLQNGS